jgi:hypothetical protein
VHAVEKERPLVSAAIAGVAALGRETNVLAILAQPVPRTKRDWARATLALLLLVVPLLVWTDYLWSIYRSNLLTDTDQATLPGAGFWHVLVLIVDGVSTNGLSSGSRLDLLIVASICVQAAFLVTRREWTRPWWRVAAGYVLLALVLDRVLWNPHTGAVTRVLLPLTVGFNIQLGLEPRPGRFWMWFVAGNMSLMTVLKVMPLV